MGHVRRQIFLSVVVAQLASASSFILPSRMDRRHAISQNMAMCIDRNVLTSAWRNKRTLAGKYWIHIKERSSDGYVWTLVPLTDEIGDNNCYPCPDGAQAWGALQPQSSQTVPLDTDVDCITLNSECVDDEFHQTIIRIVSSSIGIPDPETVDLIRVLSRIFAQWTLRQFAQNLQPVCIFFLDEIEAVRLTNIDVERLTTHHSTNWSCNNKGNATDDALRKLFLYLNTTKPSEIVEMVDAQGQALGLLPRKLVHEYNILHRGIGLFVTRDYSLSLHTTTPMQLSLDVYCHLRATDKRIFPSLYDMFVGGVSLANEEASISARREVAEELGLSKAIENLEQPCRQLECLLRGIQVCTSHNRCIVDLFSYNMNAKVESIQWQVEEVAWGAFVPYQIVQAAAERSMARIWTNNHDENTSGKNDKESEELSMLIDDDIMKTWRQWDFVPDGLLVWRAWLQYSQSLSESV